MARAETSKRSTRRGKARIGVTRLSNPAPTVYDFARILPEIVQPGGCWLGAEVKAAGMLDNLVRCRRRSMSASCRN
jgi:hypothetical protein